MSGPAVEGEKVMESDKPYVLRQPLWSLVAPTVIACSMGGITAQRLGLDGWPGRIALALALFPVVIWIAALTRPALRISGSALTLVRVPLFRGRVLVLPASGTWSYDTARNRLSLPAADGSRWSGYFSLSPQDAESLGEALRRRGIARTPPKPDAVSDRSQAVS